MLFRKHHVPPLPLPAPPPSPDFVMHHPAKAMQMHADARLGEAALHAGRMLELAYQAGDRDLAVIWKDTMYAVVKLRHARRFGLDTTTEGANLGG